MIKESAKRAPTRVRDLFEEPGDIDTAEDSGLSFKASTRTTRAPCAACGEFTMPPCWYCMFAFYHVTVTDTG